MRRYTRRDRAWGGRAWTDPIPIHPRISGGFLFWPADRWQMAENSRTGETFRIRADHEGRWAEVLRG